MVNQALKDKKELKDVKEKRQQESLDKKLEIKLKKQSAINIPTAAPDPQTPLHHSIVVSSEGQRAPSVLEESA